MEHSVVDIDKDGTLSDIRGLRLSIASPERIRSWSSGEVTDSRSFNQKKEEPMPEGLFSEQIFGPERRTRKGTSQDMPRRSRMGHIELSLPVMHPWYTKEIARLLNAREAIESIEKYGTGVYRYKLVPLPVRLDVERRERDRELLRQQLLEGTAPKVDARPADVMDEPFPDDLDDEESEVPTDDGDDELYSENDSDFSSSESQPDDGAGMGDDENLAAAAISGYEEEDDDPDVDLEADLPEVDDDPDDLDLAHVGSQERLAYDVFMLMGETDVDVELFVLRLLARDGQEYGKAERDVCARLRSLTRGGLFGKKTGVVGLVECTYASYFEWQEGTQAVRRRLEDLDLEGIRRELHATREAVSSYRASGQGDEQEQKRRQAHERKRTEVQRRADRYLRMVDGLHARHTLPTSLMLSVVPVLPPDLRPSTMTHQRGLESKRVKADANKLYESLIQLNNRLRSLSDKLDDISLCKKNDALSPSDFADNIRRLCQRLGLPYGADDPLRGGGEKHLLELLAATEHEAEQSAPADDARPEDFQAGMKTLRSALSHRQPSTGSARLQQAVDELFRDGGTERKHAGEKESRHIASLEDGLKSKRGLFRKSMLGKRVDYSGRSVIVVDPHLKLHQCGLPSTMALELFKPFVMRRLVELGRAGGKVKSIKDARLAIDRQDPVVWDALDDVIKGWDRVDEAVRNKSRVVLLNRAPTLHRLSIQAFEPVLVEDDAIHLHPLVCKSFNADFDGDQMSVHVPLSDEAQREARKYMMTQANLHSPADGSVQVAPSQDMVLGIYLLTSQRQGTGQDAEDGHRVYMDFDEAVRACQDGADVDVQDVVTVRVTAADANVFDGAKRLFRVLEGSGKEVDYDVTEHPVRIKTTVGRIVFNRQCLYPEYPFVNFCMAKKDVDKLIADCCNRYDSASVSTILDRIKREGFRWATRFGTSISVWDAAVLPGKQEMLKQAQERVGEINEDYYEGFLSNAFRHKESMHIWEECVDEVGDKTFDALTDDNPIHSMICSGARGSKAELRQLSGMRGLMVDTSGSIIEQPITSSFYEGLDPLEYFISTYGMRKGFVDQSSGTGDAGYLTRKLCYAGQEAVVREGDCGTDECAAYDLVKPGEDSVDTDLIGRCVLNDVLSPEGEVLIPAGGYLTSRDDLERLVAAGLKKVGLRSLLTCKSAYGVCQRCYGWDLSTRQPVRVGTVVGVIAAQSIGEPGTQLTLRNVNSGGVADAADITRGLPLVVKLFDASPTFMASDKVGKESPRLATAVTSLSGDSCSVADVESLMHAFVRTIKDVYDEQSVSIHGKHIEVIAAQMLRFVEITNPGGSIYRMGQLVDRWEFAAARREMATSGRAVPEAVPRLVGVRKVAALSRSWPTSVVFERVRAMLVDASLSTKSDEGMATSSIQDPISNTLVGRPPSA